MCAFFSLFSHKHNKNSMFKQGICLCFDHHVKCLITLCTSVIVCGKMYFSNDPSPRQYHTQTDGRARKKRASARAFANSTFSGADSSCKVCGGRVPCVFWMPLRDRETEQNLDRYYDWTLLYKKNEATTTATLVSVTRPMFRTHMIQSKSYGSWESCV